MFLNLFIFTIFISLIIALWEIQIEGEYGWAENLPTWRIKNKWTKFFWDDKDFTGYHFYLNLLIIAMIHTPFVVGLPWSFAKEFLFLSMLCFGTVFEDFFWFILNPAYGLNKFNKAHIIWHKHWLGFIPSMYVKYMIAATIFLWLSAHFS